MKLPPIPEGKVYCSQRESSVSGPQQLTSLNSDDDGVNHLGDMRATPLFESLYFIKKKQTYPCEQYTKTCLATMKMPNQNEAISNIQKPSKSKIDKLISCMYRSFNPRKAEDKDDAWKKTKKFVWDSYLIKRIKDITSKPDTQTLRKNLDTTITISDSKFDFIIEKTDKITTGFINDLKKYLSNTIKEAVNQYKIRAFLNGINWCDVKDECKTAIIQAYKNHIFMMKYPKLVHELIGEHINAAPPLQIRA